MTTIREASAHVETKTKQNKTKTEMGQEVQRKEYSKDKKLWVGMTTKDAAKSTELMKIFDFADYDRNGTIDKNEMQRYNGPIIVQNIETSDTRVVGRYSNYPREGSFEGILIKDNEVDYFPGLTVEHVDEKGRKDFTLIDKDHNGVLSEEEVTSIVKINDQIEKAHNTIEKHVGNKHKGVLKSMITLPLLVATAGCIGYRIAKGRLTSFGRDMSILAGAVSAFFAPVGYELSQNFWNSPKRQAKELVDNLEQEIGNEPYVQEHKMIENLREFTKYEFMKEY